MSLRNSTASALLISGTTWRRKILFIEKNQHFLLRLA
jgi:hypothetical protein